MLGMESREAIMNCNILESATCSYVRRVTNFIKHCQVENIKCFNQLLCHGQPPPLATTTPFSIENIFYFSVLNFLVCTSTQMTKLLRLTYCSGRKCFLFMGELQRGRAKVDYNVVYFIHAVSPN